MNTITTVDSGCTGNWYLARMEEATSYNWIYYYTNTPIHTLFLQSKLTMNQVFLLLGTGMYRQVMDIILYYIIYQPFCCMPKYPEQRQKVLIDQFDQFDMIVSLLSSEVWGYGPYFRLDLDFKYLTLWAPSRSPHLTESLTFVLCRIILLSQFVMFMDLKHTVNVIN